MNRFDERFPVKFGEAENLRIAVKFGEKGSFDFSADFGEIQIVAAGDAEHYTGEYIVTPDTESQTLETAGKLLDDNVTIKEIPFYNVSNNSGGSTVYIGREIE